METLFSTTFGTVYPKEDAKRKRKDVALLKQIKGDTNVPLLRFLQSLYSKIVIRNIRRDIVTNSILEKGENAQILEYAKGE